MNKFYTMTEDEARRFQDAMLASGAGPMLVPGAKLTLTVGPPRSTKDLMLTPNVTVGTDTRITAEPAPATKPGDFGVRKTGNMGTPWTPEDIDAATDEIQTAVGLLSPQQLAKVRAVMAKFGGNAPRTAAGISTSTQDAKTPSQREASEIARNRAIGEANNKRNAEFWDKGNAETDGQ